MTKSWVEWEKELKPRSPALEDTLRSHSLWLERGEPEGRKATFVEQDLSFQNLKGCDLRLADLKSANLTHVDLSDADLRGASLDFANVHDAAFSDADLRRASLIGIKGEEVVFWRARLRGADMLGCSMPGADLHEADFDTGTTDGEPVPGTGQVHARKNPSDTTSLYEADLRRAVLRGALMESVVNLSTGSVAGSFQQAARLPPHLMENRGVTLANEASKLAQPVTVTLLVTGFYGMLALLGADPGPGGRELPLALGKVSDGMFHVVFPGLILALYVYQQVVLRRFWAAVAVLPSEFPDGLASTYAVTPSPFTSFRFNRYDKQILVSDRDVIQVTFVGLVQYVFACACQAAFLFHALWKPLPWWVVLVCLVLAGATLFFAVSSWGSASDIRERSWLAHVGGLEEKRRDHDAAVREFLEKHPGKLSRF